MIGTCFGRILRVDLTARSYKAEPVREERLRSFLGGMGLGTAILHDEGGDSAPLSPENPLIMAAGPLNGTMAPGSGGFGVVTRSPLTNGLTSAQANGFFGRNLKYCGYDAVVITGRADSLVYLYITDERVEIRDAGYLSGLDSWETEERLRETHGALEGNRIGVACIGPGGENQVRYAVICSDFGHVAATGGVGAVMGAKNLKAVVVGGAIQVPLADPETFKRHVAEWRESATNSAEGKRYSQTGTAGDFTGRQALGSLPVKNLSVFEFPEHGLFSGLTLRSKYKVKWKACHSCHFTHLHTFAIKEGKYKGFAGEEADYEDLAGWGSNLGVKDPEATLWLNNLNDRLGLDSKEGTFTIGLAIECFQKGILKPTDVDGEHLAWGDPELIARLLRRIAAKEGFGDVLAEGVQRAAETIGGGAINLAVFLKKGCAPHIHDPRNLWEVLFSQVISNTPSFESIHLYRNPEPEFGIDQAPGYLDGPAIAHAVAVMTTKRQITDSLVVCNFLCRGRFATILGALNAATGWDVTFDEAVLIGRRIATLARLYNYRLGFSSARDDISERLAMPPKGGAAWGTSIRPALAEMKRIYYREMGWDPETGTPLAETVSALGLSGK